jgi:two-component system response regulator NreC
MVDQSITPPPVRILIVDDNERVRRGVAGILESRADLQPCGEAQDGSEAVQKAATLSPNLILLDVSMPGLNGLEVARLLRQQLPAVKILVMSQYDPAQLLPRAIQAGADGCVDKSLLATELLPRIDLVIGSAERKVRKLNPPPG